MLVSGLIDIELRWKGGLSGFNSIRSTEPYSSNRRFGPGKSIAGTTLRWSSSAILRMIPVITCLRYRLSMPEFVLIKDFLPTRRRISARLFEREPPHRHSWRGKSWAQVSRYFCQDAAFDVCLFDRESAPLAGVSRWNEGKIHLGYLYAADPSLETARRVIPGGLKFGPLISELIETDIAPYVTEQDEFYLVHREFVVGPDAARATLDRVSALLREQSDFPRYLVDVSGAHCRQLSRETIVI